jgi:hypothetical protein
MDIVKRLRQIDISWSEHGEWCAEAADEIERLREALKEIADAHISSISGDVENIRYGLIKRYTILVDIARAALKEGE